MDTPVDQPNPGGPANSESGKTMGSFDAAWVADDLTSPEKFIDAHYNNYRPPNIQIPTPNSTPGHLSIGHATAHTVNVPDATRSKMSPPIPVVNRSITPRTTNQPGTQVGNALFATLYGNPAMHKPGTSKLPPKPKLAPTPGGNGGQPP